MIYKVKLSEKANSQFRKLDSNDFQIVMNQLTELSILPRPSKAEKLRTRPAYRLRLDKYRVLYIVNDSEQIVNILQILS